MSTNVRKQPVHAQVRPGRGPGHHVQALDGAGDADQARWQSRTGSRSLSACQQV